ncbi:MAG: hypothetical protein QXD05_01335 [Candidatus Pacearchaeota archaeon]
MKKRFGVSFFILFISFIFINTNLAIAQQTDIANETQKVDKAYSCLQDKTNTTEKCSALSTEEKIFSTLATGRCKKELNDSSTNNGQCWTLSQSDPICRIKTTAQAILALKNANQQTNSAQNWLFSQNKSTTELAWYLQIDNTGGSSATCSVEYNSLSYQFSINEERKLSQDAGPCLTRAYDNYWFQISPTCYNFEFKVSCDDNFQTNLIFTKLTNPTRVHVTSQTHGASARGETKEKVESYCFAENNICNYEGTLWATLVLKSLNKPVSPYLPYLITFAEDNPRALPDAFLYFLTRETSYRDSLLMAQIDNKWWSVSGDKYYDTALAMYPFLGQPLTQKTNAKNWLLESQGANGCWQDHIRNTAFILASIWPKTIQTGGTTGGGGGGPDTTQLPSCTSSGYYCVSSGSCTGQVLSSQYSCPVLSECCSNPPTLLSCAELSGSSNNICSPGKICRGGRFVNSSDSLNQRCCVGGTCADPSSQTTQNTCIINNGICRPSSCQKGETTSTTYTCELSTDVCCLPEKKSKGNYTLIWILSILIVLVALGIIFREKLRNLWMKIKLKKGKPGTSSPSPLHLGNFPPGYRPSPPLTTYYPRRPVQERKILIPKPQKIPPKKPTKPSESKELDEVLKKLKEMGSK